MRRAWVIACLMGVVVTGSCGGPVHHAAQPSIPVSTSTTPAVSTTPATTGLQEPASQPGSSLQFVNDVDGWLIEGTHDILATTDGGHSWQTLSVGSYDPRTIDFVGQSDGWMLANDPNETSGQAILHTTDGGHHWTNLGEPHGAVLMTIDFSGSTTGWALSTMGTLLATTDGGVHWSKTTAPVAASLCTTTGGHLWLGTAAGSVEDTVDNGLTWQMALPWDSVPKEPSILLGSPVAPWITCSGRDAWALYDWGEAAGSALYIALASTDDGLRWNSVFGDYATGPLHSLPSVSNTPAADGVSGDGEAWFLGYCGPCDGSGTVKIVTVVGSSVADSVQLPSVSPESLDASFPDPTQGWVVGTDGVALAHPRTKSGYPSDILATADGGITWQKVVTIPDMS
jgi:hypothetical protein